MPNVLNILDGNREILKDFDMSIDEIYPNRDFVAGIDEMKASALSSLLYISSHSCQKTLCRISGKMMRSGTSSREKTEPMFTRRLLIFQPG
ncbi:hypothetical protein JTB14_036328 [Gonioctena quinquepunctata]|nr:hypothetical protein JTB14_036328 [Gonioctena quinquepunctata]